MFCSDPVQHHSLSFLHVFVCLFYDGINILGHFPRVRGWLSRGLPVSTLLNSLLYLLSKPNIGFHIYLSLLKYNYIYLSTYLFIYSPLSRGHIFLGFITNTYIGEFFPSRIKGCFCGTYTLYESLHQDFSSRTYPIFFAPLESPLWTVCDEVGPIITLFITTIIRGNYATYSFRKMEISEGGVSCNWGHIEVLL